MCSRCDEISDKAAHEWDEGVITTEPTCTEEGMKTYTCEACGKTKTESIAALGHSYGEWSVTMEPDCVNTGVQQRVCSVCQYVDSKVIPANGHNYGKWTVTKDSTCSEYGTKERTCVDCGNKDYETIEKKAHTYGAWQYDDVYHWRICTKCNEASTKSKHMINSEKECSVCGYLQPSNGLAFTLNSDGKSYAVSGIGTCTDSEIIIPSQYQGLPVTEIKQSALREKSAITKIVMQDGIERIGAFAFLGCKNLKEVIIPSSVEYIGDKAFRLCKLTNAVFENTEGWSVAITENGKKTALDSAVLASPETAATYLIDKYLDFYWFCEK